MRGPTSSRGGGADRVGAVRRWRDSTQSSLRTARLLLARPLLSCVVPFHLTRRFALIASQSGNAVNPGIIPQAVTEIFCYIRDARCSPIFPNPY